MFDQAGGNIVTANLSGFDDTEGIVHMHDDLFAIIEERSNANGNPPHVSVVEIDIENITPNTTISKPTSTTPDQNGEYYFSLDGTAVDDGNLGPEGIAYVPAQGQNAAFFYLAKETGTIHSVDLDGSNLAQVQNFPAPNCATNFSDIFYRSGSLYVISENSDPQDIFRVDMSANPLQVNSQACDNAELPQNIEGLAVNGDATKFFVVTDGENPDFRAFVSADFNNDGNIDTADFGVLGAAIVSSLFSSEMDLNDDGVVDEFDRNFFVHRLMDTVYGDSNLDGQFNSSDNVLVFQAGEYEDQIAINSTWEDGDWDGNGDFESTDLVVAFQDGCYDQGVGCTPGLEDYNPGT